MNTIRSILENDVRDGIIHGAAVYAGRRIANCSGKDSDSPGRITAIR